MSNPLFYPAGEKSCDNRGSLIPAPVEIWQGHIHIFCLKPECLLAEQSRSGGVYVASNEIRCHAPGCDKFIPEGSYGNRIIHFVCSGDCWHKLRYEQYGGNVHFICASCGNDTYGQITHGKSGNKFCDGHAELFRVEANLKTSGNEYVPDSTLTFWNMELFRLIDTGRQAVRTQIRLRSTHGSPVSAVQRFRAALRFMVPTSPELTLNRQGNTNTLFGTAQSFRQSLNSAREPKTPKLLDGDRSRHRAFWLIYNKS